MTKIQYSNSFETVQAMWVVVQLHKEPCYRWPIVTSSSCIV